MFLARDVSCVYHTMTDFLKILCFVGSKRYFVFSLNRIYEPKNLVCVHLPPRRLRIFIIEVVLQAVVEAANNHQIIRSVTSTRHELVRRRVEWGKLGVHLALFPVRS